MLISDNKNFIFIHVYKNAGTSIRNALLPYTFSKGKRTLISLLKKWQLNIPSWDPSPYHNHISASDLLEKMGRKLYKQYFSFGIVRNPWDWQVSLYKYTLKEEQHHQHDLIKEMADFNEYIKWRCEGDIIYQKDFLYSDNGELLVDFIGRFETLNEDFQRICSILDINTTLPELNVSNNVPYQEFYNGESKELVRKTFEPDISLFEYEFE